MTARGMTRILHLRHAREGGAGGADFVLMGILDGIDKSRYDAAPVYLSRHGENLTPLARQFEERSLPFTEVPGRRFVDVKQILSVRRILLDRRIMILHCHDPKSDLYGLLLLKLCPRLKALSTLHGWVEKSRRGKFYSRLDKRAVRAFHAVTAVSAHTARIARSAGVRKVVLIENGVDLRFWEPARPGDRKDGRFPEGPFAVGYSGRLSREKGPADFVRAAAKILSSDEKLSFHVAGEGPEREAAEQLADRLGVRGKIRFHGYLDREGVRDFYRRIDLLLLPSLSEGLPLSLLEAGAMMVPAVATKVGGVAEIVRHGENGYLVEPGDLEGMKKYILRLKGDSDLATAFARRARALVEANYSLRKGVARLEKLYDEMAGSDG